MILNSQINAVIRDGDLARKVRRSLWAEHLALPDEEVARTDPVALVDRVWTDRAAETEDHRGEQSAADLRGASLHRRAQV
jgi:hypothetical protein